MADDMGPSVPAEVMDRLPDVFLFRHMSREEREPLLAQARVRQVKAGETVFRQNDTPEEVFIILEGRVELYGKSGDRSRSLVDILDAGRTFGEFAIFGGSAPVTARALEPCRLVVMDGGILRERLEQRFDLVLLLLGDMSARLRGLVRRVADLKMKSTAQRLGGYLLELHAETLNGDADQNDAAGEDEWDDAGEVRGPVTLRLPFDKQLVAELLGMQPESLSRAFVKLRAMGVEASPAGLEVHVRDVSALRAFCRAGEEE